MAWKEGKLLVTQGYHRIDAHRPSRGQPASKKANDDKQQRHAKEREWISGLDAIEQAAKKTRQQKGHDQTEHQPDRSQGETAGKNHAEDTLRASAKSHTYTDFVGALAYGIGHDAINTEGREQESEDREAAEQRGIEPLGSDLARQKRLHCFDVEKRKIGVKLLHHGTHCGDQRQRVIACAKYNADFVIVPIRQGIKDFGLNSGSKAMLLRIGDNANNRQPRVTIAAAHALANGLLVREE